MYFILRFTRFTLFTHLLALLLIGGCAKITTTLPEEIPTTPSKAPTKRPITAKKTVDLWQRIRSGYQLPKTMSAAGRQRMAEYLTRYKKHPHHILQQTQSASLYLYYIVSELEKRNMPSELALLPFVESSYNPFAYSSSRASGLWQFIPSTGRHFGLEENWWADERRDIIASTQAAITYLSYLHKHFNGDWLLAIAAYNAGEGTVRKAIKRNLKQGKKSDYWSLDLPKETQRYIPKLFAWATIIRHPELHQLSLADINNTAYFTTVNIGSQIHLNKLANWTQIDIEQLHALNPAYNHWVTDPKPPHHLLIPITQATLVKQALAKHPTTERTQWQRYIVKKNDTLSRIAKTFNTQVSAIKQVNQLNNSRIYLGKTLFIPTSNTVNRLTKKSPVSSQKKRKIIYQVKKGDNLYDISNRFNVTVNNIKQWNLIGSEKFIQPGQHLFLYVSIADQANAY